MAKKAGIALSSVQRICEEYDLQPHRLCTCKCSSDPAFAEKLRDIVGPYVEPPVHSLVLSLDEKSQIQGLDRTPRWTFHFTPSSGSWLNPVESFFSSSPAGG